MPVNIVLIDDQPVIQHGLATALARYRFRIVAADLESWTGLMRQCRPRLVVIESRLGTSDGLHLLEEIARQTANGPAVAVYSEFDNPTFVARSVALGAADYLLKSQPLSEVAAALEAAVQGRAPAAESLFGKMQTFLRETPDPRASLPEMTGREYQVLRHLGLGLSNREIGNSLGISVETVKEHVQNILRKLNVNDRTHAAVQALRTGIA